MKIRTTRNAMGEKKEKEILEERTPFIVACVPAFNEEKTIAGIILKASKYVNKILVCDDGSEDMTGEIASKMGATVLRHERNMGYGAAIQSLFDEALNIEADVIVTLDGDGQHDPEAIGKLVNELVIGDFDIVIGSRFVNGKSSNVPAWRERGIRFISNLVSNDEFKTTDAQSGFRAYKRKSIETLVLTENGMGISTEILLKAERNGLTIGEVEANITYKGRKPTQNPVIQGLDVIFTTIKHLSMQRPILFYGLPGFISLIISLSFWIWTFKIFTETNRIITNIALIAVGTTITGLVLMTTSVILWVLISVIREGAR